MNLELEDRNIVVSGSSRGVGKGIARVLLEEGARITVTGRTPADVEETASEFGAAFPDRVLSFCGDLLEASVRDGLRERVIETWGSVHGVVANAGAVAPVPDIEVPDADWQWYLDTNFHVARGFALGFLDDLESTHGALVFIGSIAGVTDVGAPLPYSGAKSLLSNFALGLARRLGPRGVRVNVVEPGNIRFPGGNWDRRASADPAGVAAMLEQKVPLGRFGTPEEIGALVAFLLSSRAGFITGGRYVADGGQVLYG